jgi:DNA polymerase/3'-5' exonuclease PolX
MTNEVIAQQLLEQARELENEGGNVYRLRAYRTAAQTIQGLDRPAEEVLAQEGRKGLEALPGIGKSLGYSLEGLIQEGHWRALRPVDVGREPQRLFTSLPGVGPKLAEDLHDRLGLQTLEELHQAARTGRLAEVGVGPKRLAGLLAALEKRLADAVPPPNEPALQLLLELDREYLAGMEDNKVPRIAPRKFNSEGEPWLGLLRRERDGWKMRALFSNTALAHRLERTHDWVVIYFEKGDVRSQRTVVTEKRGDLVGRRVVRGREAECRAHYGEAPVTSEPAA